MNEHLRELITKHEEARQKTNERVRLLMEQDHLDEDGYPTDAALEIIENWDWLDTKGWFDFIKSIWWQPDWGWDEGEEPHEWSNHEQYKDTVVYRYHVSTGGWSGNESIIRAMQKNDWMWDLNWVQSRRGGHYIFEIRDYNEDPTS